MDKNKAVFLADLGLMIVAAIWGGGFIAAKYALAEYTPFVVLAIRFIGSALLTAVVFWKTIKKSKLSVIKKGMTIGLVYVIGISMQTIGLRYTSASKQAFLISLYVVFVPFISWAIIKKRPTSKDIVASFLALTGIGFLSLGETFGLGFGDLLSIGFAFMFGLNIVLISCFAKEENSIQLSFFQFLSAGIASLVMAIATNGNFNFNIGKSSMGLFYLVVFNSVVAFILQNTCQKYTSESRASLLMSLESVFGFIFSVIILKEEVTLRIVIGSLIIFSAVIVSKIQTKIQNPKAV